MSAPIFTHDVVTRRLLQLVDYDLSPEDIQRVEQTVHRLRADGWTNEEIFQHHRWSEEFSPNLDEETALKRMAVIESLVAQRKAYKHQNNSSQRIHNSVA